MEDGDKVLHIKGLIFHLESHFLPYAVHFWGEIIVIPTRIVNQSILTVVNVCAIALDNSYKIFETRNRIGSLTSLS